VGAGRWRNHWWSRALFLKDKLWRIAYFGKQKREGFQLGKRIRRTTWTCLHKTQAIKEIINYALLFR